MKRKAESKLTDVAELTCALLPYTHYEQDEFVKLIAEATDLVPEKLMAAVVNQLVQTE